MLHSALQGDDEALGLPNESTRSVARKWMSKPEDEGGKDTAGDTMEVEHTAERVMPQD